MSSKELPSGLPEQILVPRLKPPYRETDIVVNDPDLLEAFRHIRGRVKDMSFELDNGRVVNFSQAQGGRRIVTAKAGHEIFANDRKAGAREYSDSYRAVGTQPLYTKTDSAEYECRKIEQLFAVLNYNAQQNLYLGKDDLLCYAEYAGLGKHKFVNVYDTFGITAGDWVSQMLLMQQMAKIGAAYNLRMNVFGGRPSEEMFKNELAHLSNLLDARKIAPQRQERVLHILLSQVASTLAMNSEGQLSAHMSVFDVNPCDGEGIGRSAFRQRIGAAVCLALENLRSAIVAPEHRNSSMLIQLWRSDRELSSSRDSGINVYNRKIYLGTLMPPESLSSDVTGRRPKVKRSKETRKLSERLSPLPFPALSISPELMHEALWKFLEPILEEHEVIQTEAK